MDSSGRDAAIPGSQRRSALLAASVPVIATGLLVHFTLAGAAADFAADALYAVLAYLVVALAAPRAQPIMAACVAYGLCALIELAQLTGGPAALAAVFPPVRLVLGSTFAPLDLVAYAVGVGAALVGELFLRRRRVRRAT